jgi:predicted ABC-type ATPase
MPRSQPPPTCPEIIIIAGPNGAGKTTFAKEFLTHEGDCPDFINADLIASGLSPFAPEKAAVRAGKIMLDLIADRVARGESFAFETTLSGRGYVRHFKQWRRRGYSIGLIFLSLPNAETAVARVKARVAQGGHHIPDDVIRRRFELGLRNFNAIYCKLASQWWLYDNAGALPRLLAQGRNR